ncbi:hypothetical protein PAXRUDRAFT_18309 [Paxillus rubicundulus Ve08.2h10]|uniref:Uncharacterized protein n=1 Tax=Paxillus rubicundulus Ve08.2h10 TaxID=930991 RepID=A0A0D0D7M2_9AGAM|nr:hypothetical protein PAXRUDRAFT_18309 [Paxillus rubicundulus Ve08.2h10]
MSSLSTEFDPLQLMEVKKKAEEEAKRKVEEEARKKQAKEEEARWRKEKAWGKTTIHPQDPKARTSVSGSLKALGWKGRKDQKWRRQKSPDYQEKQSDKEIGEDEEDQPDKAGEEKVDALAGFSARFEDHCRMMEAFQMAIYEELAVI